MESVTKSQLSATINKRQPMTSLLCKIQYDVMVDGLCVRVGGSQQLPATLNKGQQVISINHINNSTISKSLDLVDIINGDISLPLPATINKGQQLCKHTEDISKVAGLEFILKNSSPIKRFLLHLASSGSFSVGGIKRAIHKLWSDKQTEKDSRPNHLSAKDMFDRKLFVCGKSEVTSDLKPVAMSKFHLTICTLCRDHGGVHPGCYFKAMLDCAI